LSLSVLLIHTLRSSELCVPSHNLYDPTKHISNNVLINFDTTITSIEHASFPIPWLKTDGHEGAIISLTSLNDPTSPIPAIHHHKFTNANVPIGAPLFAYKTSDGGWEPLTKCNWLYRCNEVWTAAGLPMLKAHAFHIGGCTEMLL
jgi:hypothetical protein